MSMELISKYRAQLMGVAILLVALFHCSVAYINDGFGFLRFLGDMGVDIFFLVSGVGMYYALVKKPSLREFYIKRLSRIVPPWFCMNLVVFFWDNKIAEINWITFLKCATGLSFWLDGNLYYWYIPAALVFYFVSPFFMRIYEKNKMKAYITMGGIWAVLLGLCLLNHVTRFYVFLFRFPVFFIGIWLGDLAYHKKKIPKGSLVLSVFGFLLGLMAEYVILQNLGKPFMHYEYKYIVYFIIAVPLCILLSMLFDKISYRFPVLQFLGGITLEIYLIHEFFLRKTDRWNGYFFFDSYGIFHNILGFMVVAGISYMVHKILGKLVERMRRT